MSATTDAINGATDQASPDEAHLSPRQRAVVEWFGLSADFADRDETSTAPPPPGVVLAAMPGPGGITLLTGGSGSGKSTLLARLRRHAEAQGTCVLTLPELSGRSASVPVIDLLDGEPVESSVSRLAWTGLGEPGPLMRPADTLSDGERFRLALALAVRRAEAEPGPRVLMIDEFTHALDDGCAAACASVLRRAVSRVSGLRAVVATWREELTRYLEPSITVRCDHGLWQVTRGEAATASSSRPGSRSR